MAIQYTDNLYITSARLADGYVEAWLSSETDTTATIYWRIGCRQKSAALYGQEAYGYVDGSNVGYTSGYITSSSSDWKAVCSTSGYATVNKTTSGRDVPVSINTRVTPIDGYGSVTTGWASATVNVWVSAKTSYAVKYNANGGTGAPGNQVKWHGTTLALSSTQPTRAGYTFQGWGTSSTDTSVDYAAGANYTANKAITLYAIWKVVAPAAPSGVTATRNSDTKNTIAWTRGSNADITYSSIKIERRTDGGSWSEIASVSGTTTSYSDTTTSANHYYEYRIRAYNTTGYSSYATCSTVLYNTPSAPTRVRAYRTAETTVKLEVTNAPKTATALEVQRSTDGSTWQTVSTVTGAAVTSTSDNPGGGTFYYRARNTRGSLASAWSPASNAVVTICAPSAPTLLTPVSGVVVSKAEESVIFAWTHNPIDGSAQTAAKLRYSLDKGSTWVEVAISGSAASYALENAFAVNSEVTWGVRTKGAHADYGPWSDNRVFYVYQQPSVSFTQPTDGFVIENTPIAVQLQYSDPSGTLANATLTVSDGARVVYTRDMGTETSCEIFASEWLPEDGASYTLTASVRSSSTLTATATREVTVSFVPPLPATLTIEPDPETGYVSLIAALWKPLPVSWDGDMTGVESVFSLQADVWFCKVSEDAPSVDEVVGGTVSISSEHISAEFAVGDQNIEQLAGGFYVNSESPSLSWVVVSVTGSSMSFVTYESEGHEEVITLTHGLWFVNAAIFYVSSLTGPSSGSSGGSSSITWDGDTTGLGAYPSSDINIYYKVYDGEVPSATDIVGQTMTFRIYADESVAGDMGVPAGETLFPMEITQDGINELEGHYEVNGEMGSILFVTADIVEFEDGTVTRGIYFMQTDYTEMLGATFVGHISELTLPGGGSVEPEEPKSISIYREHDGERVLLGEGLQPGAGLVDMYAPLNEDYKYEVVTFADSGAANRTTLDARIDSLWAFLYFKDGGIARGMWNPEDSWNMKQEVDYVHYIGREHPVAYMRDAMEETHDVIVTLIDREEARAFRKMMATHEPVVAKLWDSLVFHAVPQVQGKPAATVSSYWGEVAVTLTRIDGDDL